MGEKIVGYQRERLWGPSCVAKGYELEVLEHGKKWKLKTPKLKHGIVIKKKKELLPLHIQPTEALIYRRSRRPITLGPLVPSDGWYYWFGKERREIGGSESMASFCSEIHSIFRFPRRKVKKLTVQLRFDSPTKTHSKYWVEGFLYFYWHGFESTIFGGIEDFCPEVSWYIQDPLLREALQEEWDLQEDTQDSLRKKFLDLKEPPELKQIVAKRAALRKKIGWGDIPHNYKEHFLLGWLRENVIRGGYRVPTWVSLSYWE